MRDILTLATQVLIDERTLDVEPDEIVEAIVVPETGDLTQSQRATFVAVLKNPSTREAIREWHQLIATIDEAYLCDGATLLALVFVHREAKAIVDRFCKAYDEQRQIGAIPTAAPWFNKA